MLQILINETEMFLNSELNSKNRVKLQHQGSRAINLETVFQINFAMMEALICLSKNAENRSLSLM